MSVASPSETVGLGTKACPVCSQQYFTRLPRRLKDTCSFGRYGRHVHGDYVYLHEIGIEQAGWWWF